MVYETEDELLARPDQPLCGHLDGVETNARRLVPAEATVAGGDPLQPLVGTIAALHDIGKLTQWFQQYIHEDATCSRPPAYKRHSLLGAYLTFQSLSEMDFADDVAVAGFYAVAKHHGVLPDFNDSQHAKYSTTTKSSQQLRVDRFGEQLESIDRHTDHIADEIIRSATDGIVSWDDVLVDRYEGYAHALGEYSPDDESYFYTLVLRLWSTLTCADKLDAAGVTVSNDPASLPDWRRIGANLQNDAEGLLSTLNEYRTSARNDATERLKALDESVYTLTLPTGFGKTLAGLESALSEAERTDGRVIYALPFTTVIDQVHDEVTDKLEVTPERGLYTLHHHLADTRTKVGEDNERVSDGSEVLYGESWQSGLVLTTFVQLFESLAGPKNTQSIKLPALQDSVIIVDEPQAVTKDWWYLVSRLTTMLVEEYNATVILMTATQPGIIAETNPELDPTELIPSPETYFDFLESNERVRFDIDESVVQHIQQNRGEGVPIDAAGRRLYQAIQLANTDSVLAVSNTVRAAGMLYRATSDAIEDHGGSVRSLGAAVADFRDSVDANMLECVDQSDEALEQLVTAFLTGLSQRVTDGEILLGALSTAIRPIERGFLIAVIRRLIDDDEKTPLDGHGVIVSSTQLVEAGVDVSFDRLYRDYAPIPSLVQAAGRCNRSFSGETATVTLWRLAGIDENPPPSELYKRDGNLLKPTAYALRSMTTKYGQTIPEHVMVSDGVSQYYGSLHQDDRLSVESDSLARAVDTAQGETLREASLINDDSSEAVVVTNESDAVVLRAYVESRASRGYTDASSAFDRLKYLSTSTRGEIDDDLQEFITTDTAVEPGELDLSEITVVDARGTGEYLLRDGSGVRQIG